MSKLVKTQMIGLAVLAPVVSAIAWKDPGLASVAVLVAWIYNAILAFSLLGLACLVSGLGKGKDNSTVADMIAVRDGRSVLRKAWAWLQAVILVGGLAYIGASFTGFFTAMLLAALKLVFLVARERLKAVAA